MKTHFAPEIAVNRKVQGKILFMQIEEKLWAQDRGSESGYLFVVFDFCGGRTFCHDRIVRQASTDRRLHRLGRYPGPLGSGLS